MKVFILFIFFFLGCFSFAQKKVFLKFENEEVYKFKRNITSSFNDTLELKKYIQQLQLLAIKEGYLLASIDNYHLEKDTLKVDFILGKKFKNAYLKFNTEDLFFLKKVISINEKIFLNLPFNPEEIAKELAGIISSLENNGYPFAQAYLSDISFENEDLYAKVNINSNSKYKWSKFIIKGDESVSVDFISNLIGFSEGDLFDQSLVETISLRIKQLSYLSEIKPFELLFTEEGVQLFLYLKTQQVSSANGVIGFQPNPTTNKLSLTGDISLKLINSINRGESLILNWKSIQAQTQSLNSKLNIPFLFHSRFGIEGVFNLFKRDTSFLELKSSFGIQYFLKKGSYIKTFYGRTSSTVLSASNTTSNYGFVQTNHYGLNYSKTYFDYIPNPKKGLSMEFEISVGDRKSRPSDTVSFVNSTTYNSSFNFQWVIPIHKRHVLYYSNQSASYYAPIIFQNEVFRFGGQTTQRGFNEQNLYATTRITNTIEYRYLLDKNSRLFAFFEQTWYENNSYQYYKDHPFGFGAGMTFGTNLGIFSLSYALGKQFNNSILISDGKIHFGYISYF